MRGITGPSGRLPPPTLLADSRRQRHPTRATRARARRMVQMAFRGISPLGRPLTLFAVGQGSYGACLDTHFCIAPQVARPPALQETGMKSITSALALAVAAGSLFVYQKKGMGVLISFPTGFILTK